MSNINFYLESDIIIRIIYLIRNNVSDLSTNGISKPLNEYKKPLYNLTIFPEKKYLNQVYKEISQHADFLEIQKSCNLKIFIYTGDSNKNSKETVKLLTSLKTDLDYVIIFSTRSGIFLPFFELNEIFLIDESNSMHIQDQNSIYFDTRDSVFLLAQSHDSNLQFISYLPSIRLHSFYSKGQLNKLLINNTRQDVITPKIKITSKNNKYDNFRVFSNQISDLLNDD